MLDCEKDFWNTFTKLYLMTKEMYIKAEEYDDDFCSIMQPIKEQRDSLDHIVRSYSQLLELENNTFDDETKEKKEDHIYKNFDKAIGHMYRAFYDTADILTITLREHISNVLQPHSYVKICSCWEDYEATRKKLVNITKKIIKLRYKKEIKPFEKEQQELFDDYKEILDFLFATLDTVLLDVYPKLNQ